MKNLTKILSALAVVLVLCFSAGCAASPETKDAYDHFIEVKDRVSADGVITPAEMSELTEAFQAWASNAEKDAQRTDWATLIGGTAGAALTAFLGTNVYRNRREQKVWGTPPAQPPATTAT